MKKLIVKNLQRIQTHGATSSQFPSLSEFESWVESTRKSGAWGLPEREELDEMGEPTGVILPEEFVVEIIDITEQVEQERINAEALAYLAETDWLAVRQAETGVQMPEDVRIARQAAREKIIK